MSDNPAEQVLSDLFGYLELLETQSGALLQFLKDHKIAILNRPKDELDRAQIVASVAAQHHWNIRAFRDFEQAFEQIGHIREGNHVGAVAQSAIRLRRRCS